MADHAVDVLIELCAKAGIERRVRLSASDKLTTPVAVGRSEIILSRHAIDELPTPQLQGVIGHELGHLEARDPGWGRAIAIVEIIGFLQRLNFWAKRRHRDAAELAADDWARRWGVRVGAARRAALEPFELAP